MSLKPHVLLPLGAAALLSACAGNLHQAEQAPVAGNAFAAALQSGYVKLAQGEADENDFDDAAAFADRALAASRGKPTEPEKLSARKLPSEAVPALASAREKLVAALDHGARDSAPAAAAHAQLGFDCWMQEQEENFQLDDIAACRREFDSAMGDVERRIARAEPLNAIRPTVTPASYVVPERAATPVDSRFTVYFAFDGAGLDEPGEKVLSKAAAAARRTGAAAVRVIGYTDRAGPRRYNMKLSRERAQQVTAALRRLGLPDIGVATLARGEENPAVATADGVREPRNRRVEIELTH